VPRAGAVPRQLVITMPRAPVRCSSAPVTNPRAQAMCLVNFQPDEEIGSSCAAEDSCAAEILIFDWRLDNLWIVATGRENL